MKMIMQPGEPTRFYRGNRYIGYLDDEWLYVIRDNRAVPIEPAPSLHECIKAIQHYEQEQGIEL